jgi:hypothetical protein
MSDLDWLARIETRRREWGGGFFLADAEVDFVLAAARAHLEATEDWYCEHGVSMGVRCQYCIESYGCGRKTALAMVPQPPQQREDDGRRNDSVSGADNASGHDLGADKYVVTPALKQREGWWTKHWASGEAL